MLKTYFGGILVPVDGVLRALAVVASPVEVELQQFVLVRTEWAAG